MSNIPKHKVFISFKSEDIFFKEHLSKLAKDHDLFDDYSVDTGDINDDLKDITISRKIRDKYIKEATVTILLVGKETKDSTHVDRELHYSMIDGEVNSKMGIIVLYIDSSLFKSNYHPNEDSKNIFNKLSGTTTIYTNIKSEQEWRNEHSYLPKRITDQILSARKNSTEHNIVIDFLGDFLDSLESLQLLKELIYVAFLNRKTNKYYFDTPMKKNF